MAEHVRLHGGRVWSEDAPGGGTSFVVELPLVPDGARSPVTDRRGAPVTRARTRVASGLVVAAVALVLGACGIPTASSPSPIAKSDVPYHLLDPATTTTTVPGTPPAVGVPELIFLVAPSGHLVAATREVAVPASLTQVVGALLAGPTATESARGSSRS